MADYTGALAYFTAALAFVGALGLVGAVIQIRFLTRADRGAKASLDHAIKSSEQELRAYVHHAEAKVTYDVNGIPKHVVTIVKNYGKTPAQEVIYWQGCDVFSTRAPLLKFKEPDEGIELSNSILPPSGHVIMMTPFNPMNDAQVVEWMNKKTAAYAWGCVKYVDCFGVGRETRYLYFITYGNPEGLMAPYQTGNSAT